MLEKKGKQKSDGHDSKRGGRFGGGLGPEEYRAVDRRVDSNAHAGARASKATTRRRYCERVYDVRLAFDPRLRRRSVAAPEHLGRRGELDRVFVVCNDEHGHRRRGRRSRNEVDHDDAVLELVSRRQRLVAIDGRGALRLVHRRRPHPDAARVHEPHGHGV